MADLYVGLVSESNSLGGGVTMSIDYTELTDAEIYALANYIRTIPSVMTAFSGNAGDTQINVIRKTVTETLPLGI